MSRLDMMNQMVEMINNLTKTESESLINSHIVTMLEICVEMVFEASLEEADMDEEDNVIPFQV